MPNKILHNVRPYSKLSFLAESQSPPMARQGLLPPDAKWPNSNLNNKKKKPAETEFTQESTTQLAPRLSGESELNAVAPLLYRLGIGRRKGRKGPRDCHVMPELSKER
jgi:hypothetical protein